MTPRSLMAAVAAVATLLSGCGLQPDASPASGLADPSASSSPSPTPAASPTATVPQRPTPAPAPTATPSPAPTGSPSAPPVVANPDRLQVGDEGPAVAALQQQLVSLRYWLGTPDGVFDDATAHAVVALQKAAGISRDGIVGPQTRAALSRRVVPQPRSQSGVVIEIDRDRQLLLLTEEGTVAWTFDTSTGRAGCTTPAGRYRIDRQIDGYRTSPLGVLYRPKYFNQGIAIHGYPSVPPYPASHGCVRLTNAAMDHLWATDAAPLGTPVWVY